MLDGDTLACGCRQCANNESFFDCRASRVLLCKRKDLYRIIGTPGKSRYIQEKNFLSTMHSPAGKQTNPQTKKKKKHPDQIFMPPESGPQLACRCALIGLAPSAYLPAMPLAFHWAMPAAAGCLRGSAFLIAIFSFCLLQARSFVWPPPPITIAEFLDDHGD